MLFWNREVFAFDASGQILSYCTASFVVGFEQDYLPCSRYCVDVSRHRQPTTTTTTTTTPENSNNITTTAAIATTTSATQTFSDAQLQKIEVTVLIGAEL